MNVDRGICLKFEAAQHLKRLARRLFSRDCAQCSVADEMQATAAIPADAMPSARVPWYFKLLVFGALCIPVGALWDISWHSTIGRDTFWTPAHIVTYMGGLIPGLVCGWLALKTHFWGSVEERAAAVSFWGFRAPIGAWITIWGCFTMLLSAPFDD